ALIYLRRLASPTVNWNGSMICTSYGLRNEKTLARASVRGFAPSGAPNGTALIRCDDLAMQGTAVVHRAFAALHLRALLWLRPELAPLSRPPKLSFPLAYGGVRPKSWLPTVVWALFHGTSFASVMLACSPTLTQVPEITSPSREGTGRASRVSDCTPIGL